MAKRELACVSLEAERRRRDKTGQNRNKKLLGASASLLVTNALLVVRFAIRNKCSKVLERRTGRIVAGTDPKVVHSAAARWRSR